MRVNCAPATEPETTPRDTHATVQTSPITLRSHVAGSGTLDRLVETTRNYAPRAAFKNTLKGYAKDWAFCKLVPVEIVLGPFPAGGSRQQR